MPNASCRLGRRPIWPKSPGKDLRTSWHSARYRVTTRSRIWRKTSNMLAVSNTSPISNLASIGRLELLKSQFSELWIPDAVFVELTAHPDPIAQASIQTAIRDQWIRIGTSPDSGLLRLLLLQLHQGEAEAIALATDLHAEIVL